MRAASDTSLELRIASDADAELVVALGARAFVEYDPHAAGTTRRLMQAPGARTLLAERAGRPIGLAIVRPASDAVLAVDALAVTESERGRGVGRQLMRAVERRAIQRGFRAISLTTAQANLAALDLFLRLGFVITGRVARYYFGGQPACQLQKRLGEPSR